MIRLTQTTQALDYLRTSESSNWFKYITPEVLARARTPRYRYNLLL
jgi:hypothetical protein